MTKKSKPFDPSKDRECKKCRMYQLDGSYYPDDDRILGADRWTYCRNRCRRGTKKLYHVD